MLKAAVAGVGRMGQGHIGIYRTLMKEGYPVKLVALCDVDEDKFKGFKNYKVNLADSKDIENEKTDYKNYNLYTCIDEMLKNEELDVINVVVPTFVHEEVSIKALKTGVNVLCEKPMALTVESCQRMIDAAKESGKLLMIGQCLHFWHEYEVLKEFVESGKFGKVTAADFYRGGAADHVNNPSWRNWIIQREYGGGGLFDQHIHDTDMIRWLFGTPDAVSTRGVTIRPGSAYDICSTNYYYDDKVVSARDDTTYCGQYGFKYGFTVNFEKASVTFHDRDMWVYPEDAEAYMVDKSPNAGGHYGEIKYFLDCVRNNTSTDKCKSEGAMETIRICLAEMESADNAGSVVKL
ncbi:MAG: Gfo/Idh/MocA family oxidoreductase [Clostridiales bacterium]|nr:Gfo/Idh/MocA family oxidoreductase [Clostridiales bacterium]